MIDQPVHHQQVVEKERLGRVKQTISTLTTYKHPGHLTKMTSFFSSNL